MGAIEDTRKILQDILTPEIREVKARLDALEKRMDDRFDSFGKSVDERFESFGKRMDERFDSFEKRMDERFNQVERRAELRHDAVMIAINGLANYNEVRERLTKLESKESVAA